MEVSSEDDDDEALEAMEEFKRCESIEEKLTQIMVQTTRNNSAIKSINKKFNSRIIKLEEESEKCQNLINIQENDISELRN